jgi:hypothetical protein
MSARPSEPDVGPWSLAILRGYIGGYSFTRPPHFTGFHRCRRRLNVVAPRTPPKATFSGALRRIEVDWRPFPRRRFFWSANVEAVSSNLIARSKLFETSQPERAGLRTLAWIRETSTRGADLPPIPWLPFALLSEAQRMQNYSQGEKYLR